MTSPHNKRTTLALFAVSAVIVGCLLSACRPDNYYLFHADYERQVNQALQRPGLRVERVIDRRHTAQEDIGVLAPGLIAEPKQVRLDQPVSDFVRESLSAMLHDSTATRSDSIALTVYVDSFYVSERFATVLKHVEFHSDLTFVLKADDGREKIVPTSAVRTREWAVVTPEEAEKMMYYGLRECVDSFLVRYDKMVADSGI